MYDYKNYVEDDNVMKARAVQIARAFILSYFNKRFIIKLKIMMNMILKCVLMK